MAHVNAVQQAFPGKSKYTENDIDDQTGKVFLVTGATSGIGREVARILYSKNGTVWIAGRNEEKGREAIKSISEAHHPSGGGGGQLKFLHLDLGDLEAVKKSAEVFLGEIAKEGDGKGKLHVLFNNAGVMFPPRGSKTKQGYELQLGTNCLGHFLLTKLLTPLLVETARVEREEKEKEKKEAEATAPPPAVRVVWVSSSVGELLCPKGGVDLGNLDYKRDVFYVLKYGMSKAGNYYHATEYGRRLREEGVASISLNPGNIATELDRHCNVFELMFRKATTWPVIFGAYTELYAGLSKDVTVDRLVETGDWVVPWARFSSIKKDLRRGSKPESEGGTGIALKFWDWSEEQVKPYV